MYTQVYFKIKKNELIPLWNHPPHIRKALKAFLFLTSFFLKTNLLFTLKLLTYCYPFTFY